MKDGTARGLDLELNILQKKLNMGNTNIKTNIYSIQENNLIISRYFCTGFVDFMPKAFYFLLINMKKMIK